MEPSSIRAVIGGRLSSSILVKVINSFSILNVFDEFWLMSFAINFGLCSSLIVLYKSQVPIWVLLSMLH